MYSNLKQGNLPPKIQENSDKKVEDEFSLFPPPIIFSSHSFLNTKKKTKP
jgi:hypothetical protein